MFSFPGGMIDSCNEKQFVFVNFPQKYLWSLVESFWFLSSSPTSGESSLIIFRGESFIFLNPSSTDIGVIGPAFKSFIRKNINVYRLEKLCFHLMNKQLRNNGKLYYSWINKNWIIFLKTGSFNMNIYTIIKMITHNGHISTASIWRF